MHFVYQNAVAALADLDTALIGVGLAILVKGHYDYSRPVALDFARLSHKVFFAFFKADRIYHGLALHHLEPGL